MGANCWKLQKNSIRIISLDPRERTENSLVPPSNERMWCSSTMHTRGIFPAESSFMVGSGVHNVLSLCHTHWLKQYIDDKDRVKERKKDGRCLKRLKCNNSRSQVSSERYLLWRAHTNSGYAYTLTLWYRKELISDAIRWSQENKINSQSPAWDNLRQRHWQHWQG